MCELKYFVHKGFLKYTKKLLPQEKLLPITKEVSLSHVFVNVPLCGVTVGKPFSFSFHFKYGGWPFSLSLFPVGPQLKNNATYKNLTY